MSLLLSRESSTESEVGGGGLSTPHLSDFSVNYHNNNNNNNNNSFSQDEGSVDGDRPNSRLTIIESPTTSYDQEEDFPQFGVDSPDVEDDYYESSPRHQSTLKPGGSHTCDECFKTFSSPGKLKQHEYTHTGETPFECKIPGCDKKFTSKFKLKRHILIHSQTKTFLCETCHRAFRRKDHLKNHEKVHDPGKQVYTCSYNNCGRTYNSVSSFRKHQAMHSAEEGQLDCKICKMVLQSQDELMNHLKVHAGSRTIKGSVDKKFVCNQCEKKFFTRKDLKRHSVVHTGNREFSCPHCTQRFGRKDHMTRHAKKTHASFYENSRTRLISTPVPDHPTDQELPRSSRKERSISDPGPVPVSPAINHPSEHKLMEESAGVHQPLQATNDFHKLVTQDNVDKVKTQPLAIQRQVIVHPSSTSDSFNRPLHQRNIENSDSYKQNLLHIRTPNITRPNTSVKAGSSQVKSREPPILFQTNIPQTGLTYNQSGPLNFYSRESGNEVSSQDHITTGQHLNYEQERMAVDQKENFQLNEMHTKRDRTGSKVGESPPTNELQKLLTLDRKSVIIKEEEPSPKLYDEDLTDENAIKELLAEKDRIDLTSFMTEFTDDLPPNLSGRKRIFLNPPSPSMDEESLLPKYLEENLIKMEPNSRPSSPMDSTIIQDNFTTSNEQYPSFDADPLDPDPPRPGPYPHLIPLQPKPRTIFIRTQSQDSLTKTKNPVLPSIHAESNLVVPEPNQIKYPTVQNPLFLGFSDEKDDQLTELRGSLFLSEDYGQSYFQPWN